MTMNMWNVVHGLKPAMMMITVQTAFAGVNVFYKLAANDGMSLRVLVAYRCVFAAAFIVPLALVVERKSRPKLTWVVLFQAFLCGLFGGSLIQNLYVESLALTSATFTAAMTNLIPAITFILAVSFGMERLGFGTLAGKAKVLGTLMCIGGAMLLTFYKGVEIDIWSTQVDLMHNGQIRGGHVTSPHKLLGSLLAVASCLSCAMWLIVQAKMSDRYPCHFSSTALMSVMASIQAVVYALCTERDWSQWKLGWNIRLLTVVYTGIVASGVMMVLIAWCVRMRGPLYVSIFNPLMLILVALVGSLILNEKLYLGSILGAMLIICGLYVVLWGKGKELERITRLVPSKSSRESESIEGEIFLNLLFPCRYNADSEGHIGFSGNSDNSLSIKWISSAFIHSTSFGGSINSKLPCIYRLLSVFSSFGGFFTPKQGHIANRLIFFMLQREEHLIESIAMTMNIWNIVHGLKPAMMMMTVQTSFAGVNVFYKLAANDGMSLRVLVAYRCAFAAAFIVPLALVVERKSRPKLTWVVLFQAFLCGLFGGSLVQNLYVESLALTSATFTAAMTNLIPAITFILAVSFGMERLGFGTLAGKAKVLGTLMGIGGAMLLTFYKGVEIDIWSTQVDLLHNGQLRGGHVTSPHKVLGSLLAVASCLSYAMWLVVQAKMSDRYPCHFSSTALMSVMASIQAVVYALCTEKDWSQWKLGWNIRLLTVVYTGIVASGVMMVLIAWCVRMRGPLYVSIFNPLMLILVALVGSLILNEKLYLGSILGAMLIICGLYVVLWGKGKELVRITRLVPSKSSRESESIEVVITSTANDDDDDDDDNNNKNNNNIIIAA
ncbi:hypothetical protein L1049_014564 [Liquidambar formosana]|uniref:EamA domain-containing protein n=1 Tax=Liquidambar formosana TaxID=63359 RepID=A0AAP0X1W8_LIQFO